ncbi:MAG: response regulator transcription factor [Chloroflexi bacterium]|nr:response regulator transcription factor [Chloroflexota bacterium]MCL5107953.1 response regulator transcription factor [Chloroflexota bacterium]
MPKILVVDDEPNLLHSVAYSLRREGHEVLTAADGEEALKLARGNSPDAIVLDVMLPKLDGFEVCRRLRSESQVPILMLTAKDSEIDRVVGLEIGADDYLTKPFSMRELQARVKALLRRSIRTEPASGQKAELLRAGELSVDLARRRVLVAEREVALKPKEFDLLAYLLANRGRVFTREALLRQVWGYPEAGITRTVDAHVRALREKLGDDVDSPKWLETVRGVGYRAREA